jgi:RNA-directed DNA polymerase
LFDAVCSFENLAWAARRAQVGKRYRAGVLRFNHRREDALHRLSRSLGEGSWRPSPHRHFLIHEPKVRWISAAPYHDRVVHHALCNVIEPLIDRRLVFDCWANRKGKGSHRAALRYQRFAGRHRYALKVDIRKYFPSIDHAILKDQLGRIFKDRRLLSLMHQLVDGGQVPEPHDAYFPGDDLFTPLDRAKGLPIGNLTSQVWANLYLSDFDHWVQQHLGCRAYVRFVDDFILLADSKPVLHEWKACIVDRLRACRLQLHPRKSVILRTDEGVPFLGYVVWPGRIRVRGETVRRFRRRLRQREREGTGPERRQSLTAWKGHVQLAGCWRRVASPRHT